MMGPTSQFVGLEIIDCFIKRTYFEENQQKTR